MTSFKELSKDKCTIKISLKEGTGAVTRSVAPPPYEQVLPLSSPYFKMFLEKFMSSHPLKNQILGTLHFSFLLSGKELSIFNA